MKKKANIPLNNESSSIAAYRKDTINKILGELLKSPIEPKSMRQLALSTKLSYATVFKITPLIESKRIVKLVKQGHSTLVCPIFEIENSNLFTSAMLQEKINLYKKYPQIALISKEIESSLPRYFFVLLLFGSYAKGTAKKDSDIDLLMLIPDGNAYEIYKEKTKKSLKLYPLINVHLNIVTLSDFYEMLNQKYSLGREAFINSIVLFGCESYYNLVGDYVRTKGY